MSKDLLEHLRVRLAATLVGRPGDVEVTLPTVGAQHPIKPAAGLAGSHRQAIALGTKALQRLDHTVEQW
ncbi:hypothetical protein D3C85_1369720 [compost metagenome]